MAVVTTLYPQFKYDLLNKATNVTTDVWKVALFSASTYTSTDTTYTTSGTEVANGNGYTTGGATSGAVTTSTATTSPNLVKIAGTTSWTSSGAGFSAVAAKVYNSTVSNHPVAHVDFGGTQTASGGGTFTITWDSTNGLFNLA